MPVGAVHAKPPLNPIVRKASFVVSALVTPVISFNPRPTSNGETVLRAREAYRLGDGLVQIQIKPWVTCQPAVEIGKWRG
jgi:hypothetical protein